MLSPPAPAELVGHLASARIVLYNDSVGGRRIAGWKPLRDQRGQSGGTGRGWTPRRTAEQAARPSLILALRACPWKIRLAPRLGRLVPGRPPVRSRRPGPHRSPRAPSTNPRTQTRRKDQACQRVRTSRAAARRGAEADAGAEAGPPPEPPAAVRKTPIAPSAAKVTET
jgi:hypothetical protein